MKNTDKGPVEVLCKEIGFRFDPRYEQPEILLSFVSVLVEHVAHRVSINKQIGEALGVPPEPSEFDRVLSLLRATITSDDPITNAALTHDLVHEVNPEDGPCDHNIDMLSSCASAVRFGLESPCQSRHAAEAASHVWKRIYGIALFDQFTPEWCNDWARAQFQEAIFRLTNTSENSEAGKVVSEPGTFVGGFENPYPKKAERYWEERWRDEKAENERLRAHPIFATTTGIHCDPENNKLTLDFEHEGDALAAFNALPIDTSAKSDGGNGDE